MRELSAYALLLLVACGGGMDEVSEVLERDSGGVRILEYGRVEPASDLRLSDEPRFVHGTGAQDYLFETIWDAALQPDGGAVVADVGSQEVVAIGPDGAVRSVLARQGAGPAEVRGLTGITVLGQDSVLVEDDGNARISLFVRGAVERSYSTAGDFSITDGLRIDGVDEAGRALMSTSAWRPSFEGPWLAASLARMDLARGTTDTVATCDLVRAVDRSRPLNPFAPVGQVAVAGGHFVCGRSDRAELIWWSAGGEPMQIVRWVQEPAAPTDADWASWTAQMRADLRRVNPGRTGAAFEEMVVRQLGRFQMAEAEPLPLWSEIVGDVDGRVWVGQYAATGPRAGVESYALFGRRGERLGRILMPEQFRVLDARGSLVLGVQRDSLGVEAVVVYELLGARGARTNGN